MTAPMRRAKEPEPLAIDYRSTTALIPYARNARTHSESQVALIAGSIREYGFTNPVLVDGESGIIAGHGRILAAMKLGLATVPVIELAHLSEAQKRAYVLADNKLAERAGWDVDLLGLELADLSDLGVELGNLGFEDDELEIADTLAASSAPVALIAAERDTIVPPRRTEPVRRSAGNIVLDRVIMDACHNDLRQRRVQARDAAGVVASGRPFGG